MTRIAFLGTGLMGAPIALRLLAAGHSLTAWNRSIEKTAPLIDKGATVARTPANAVAGAELICLCLTDGKTVESVLFGPNGAIETLGPASVIIDFSTIGPDLTRSFAERVLTTRGTAWIDAPITGGVKGAETGELVILCGGRADLIDTVTPVLRSLSKRICHLGPLGAGQAAKLCNQLIVTVNVLAIAEAMRLGQAHGLDVTMLPDALRGGWADSLPLQIIGNRMASGVCEPRIVSVGTFAKDIALVTEGATGLPLAAAANTIYQGAAAAGIGEDDATALRAYVQAANLL